MRISGSASDGPAPDWRRNLTSVTVATFIGFTGFTLVMPFLPLYFEELGVHDQGRVAIWAGVSLGVTPAVTAAMAPVWARVAERYGRKLMVARSLFSFVVIMAAMAFVTRPWHVFGLRAVQGLFAGYGPIAMTMAAESAPPEYMAASIGWVQTAQRLGPALGPVIGGALAVAVGLRETFVVSAAFYFAACLLVVWGYREVTGGRRARAAAPAGNDLTFAALRRVRYFVLFMGTIFGLQLVDRSFGPVLPLYLGEIGVPDANVPFLSGVIFTITAGAAAVGNQTSVFWLRRHSLRAVVSVMSALAAVGAVVFGLAPPLSVLMGTAVIFGLGMGIATTSVYAAASAAVPASSRGLAFGYLTTAYLLGLAVSPVIAGMIGAASMRAVFFADAIGLAVTVWIVRWRMQPEAV